MGNFSSKDGHGPTGVHAESFHTPPTSPQSIEDGFLPGVPHFHSSPGAPVSPPPPAPGVTSTGRKSHRGTPTTPTPTTPPPDWRPPPPVASNTPAVGPGVSPVHGKPGNAATGRGQASSGTNGGPPTSTPRTPTPQETSDAVSPLKSPSSQCSASPPPPAGALKHNWRERDSGLCQSLPPGQESKDGHGEELEKLLEECRTTLGIAACQDGSINTTEILKHLLTEVKSLKSTLETERGEWLQFQADLQVAVAVADRLRAEAEEELTALRTAHRDTERELAAAQQRQKDADVQLATVRGELNESRQRLAAAAQPQDKSERQRPRPEPDGPNEEPLSSDSGNGSQRGRVVQRLGREPAESRSQNEPTKNAVGQEERTDCKGVAKRYLRNVTNEERSGDGGRVSETRRMLTTERSRSLSRLPASSDCIALQNGQGAHPAETAGPTKTIAGRVPRNLDWQDSRSNGETGKREESLNKYNSALTELPPAKSQDGFNLLLRRHGGSKRNSLLRWCQNRTQGYKNIDITNFSSSWADGLAFCAVYHTYLPSHIPFSILSPDNKKENLSLAFKTGEDVGIVQTLTVEEMLRAGGPDWQRVLSYVESMYRHFEM
ncbi:cytospin-A [Salarias fasciatus]|nr:cytospin-A-like [Salarias fasciatus]